MKKENVHCVLDACVIGGRIQSLLPPLPDGVRPTDIRVAHKIAVLEETQERVFISDIGELLEVTLPAVTVTVNRLCRMGYAVKERSQDDRRMVQVMLTEKGWALYRHYVDQFHEALAAEAFDWLSDEEALRMMDVMEHLTRSITAFTRSREAQKR